MNPLCEVCFRNRRPDLHRRHSMSNPDPFQELVDSSCSFITTNTTSTSGTGIPSSLIPLISSPMAKPAPFSGVAEKCNGFILQCSLALEMQPHLYPTESSKIAFILSLLMRRALQWAETIWSQAGTVTQSLNNFISHFRDVFCRSTGDPSISDQLYHLHQGSKSIHDYALQFRTQAAANG